MITQIDFSCIGQIAKHCDNDKLCIAINESLDFDLYGLFCDEIMTEALDNYNAISGFWFELWNGGTFTTPCEKVKNHLGLKRIWIYYAYSRYILLNGYNDTATGFKQKTNDFSLPIPIKELQVFEQKYRDMGYESYNKTKQFICQNLSNFTVEPNIECESECLCGSEKCGGKTRANVGLKSKIISKYD